MLSEELAYLAGIIDGEGCFFIDFLRKGGLFRPHLYIDNTSPKLMEWLQARLQGWVHASQQIPSEKKHLWKHEYRFSVPIPTLRNILPSLLPYLVIKKRHAELMLEYFALVPYRWKRGGLGRGHRLTVAERARVRELAGTMSQDDIATVIGRNQASVSRLLLNQVEEYQSDHYPRRVFEIYKELKFLNRKGPQKVADVEKRVQEVEAKLQ